MSENDLEALSTLLQTRKPVGLRGFLIVGEDDSMSLEVTRKVVEMMDAYDLPCKREVVPGLGHSYPEGRILLNACSTAWHLSNMVNVGEVF